MRNLIIGVPDSITDDQLTMIGCSIIGPWKAPIKRAAKPKQSAAIEHQPMIVRKSDGSTREIDSVSVAKLCAKVPMFKKPSPTSEGSTWVYPDAVKLSLQLKREKLPVLHNDDGEFSSPELTRRYVEMFSSFRHYA